MSNCSLDINQYINHSLEINQYINHSLDINQYINHSLGINRYELNVISTFLLQDYSAAPKIIEEDRIAQLCFKALNDKLKDIPVLGHSKISLAAFLIKRGKIYKFYFSSS